MSFEVFQTIGPAVGEWSNRNFGNNESKALPGIVLGPVGSLLGMFEEIGELMDDDAVMGNEEAADDCLADFLIFSCDWFHRMGWCISEGLAHVRDMKRGNLITNMKLLRAVGQFCHANLKTHQGIRGYNDPTFAKNSLLVAWARVFESFFSIYMEVVGYKTTAIKWQETSERVLITVWEKVSKRDWKANPTNAGEV